MEKVIGRINVHFPVAHQYSYTYTTFIQYGHKKNIGRINVHFFPPWYINTVISVGSTAELVLEDLIGWTS